jgi:uncharacterized protein YkwD
VSTPRTIPTALASIGVLACLATSPTFVGASDRQLSTVTPVAKIAHSHAASHKHKHARTSCHNTVKRHRKHHKHCRALTRDDHKTRGAHRTGANTPFKRAHNKHSSTPKAPTLHAKGAGHASEPTTTVVLAPVPATIASVLATPCQNTETAPTAGNLEQAQDATVCLINQERARHGELPLSVNAQLTQAATLHSQDMLATDYFAHVSPGGETPLERVQASGYIPSSKVGYTVGENIAWGTLYLATPSSIVAAWIASPEHLANILNASYRDTAVAIAPAAPPSLANGQPGAIYTQEFGVVEG